MNAGECCTKFKFRRVKTSMSCTYIYPFQDLPSLMFPEFPEFLEADTRLKLKNMVSRTDELPDR